MKPPYGPKMTELMRSHVYAGLKILTDTGAGANFEDFCDAIIDAFPEKYYAEEWIHYWKYWKDRFRRYNKTEQTQRMGVFEECINDCRAKGLFPSEITGLTANFQTVVKDIINENNPAI